MFRAVIISTLICVAGSVDGMAKPPAHKSLAAPVPAARPDCLDSTRLLSHVAFTDTALPKMHSCSQYLSTDTLVAVRHWGRT
jgi:hypothetical protein